MKVIKKGQTHEGIVIRVEDWSEDYSCYAYGSLVTAYPKNTAASGLNIKQRTMTKRCSFLKA